MSGITRNRTYACMRTCLCKHGLQVYVDSRMHDPPNTHSHSVTHTHAHTHIHTLSHTTHARHKLDSCPLTLHLTETITLRIAQVLQATDQFSTMRLSVCTMADALPFGVPQQSECLLFGLCSVALFRSMSSIVFLLHCLLWKPL